MIIPFDNTYVLLPPHMFARVRPEPAPAPKLLAFNLDLANALGMTGEPDADTLAGLFSGNIIPDGADPIAQAYAGHQFGNFVPSLGDGRAILLGEVIDQSGQRHDIQLKGSGRTPFSRGGDGKAWLGPVLREYIVSEAMYHMGIPTTRALAAVTTGETILRAEGPVPGAVLTRVAASHIRVGTFQYFAARRDTKALTALLDYAIARHDPTCATPADFLKSVIDRQVDLIARWMGVGFIHGVMNTDNTSISGETIDYGPCAFIDRYHPATVFSSIDRHGRYAYQNQPDILVWNMAQLASALLLLEPDQQQAINHYTALIHAMPAQLDKAWLRVFSAKLGLRTPKDGDAELVTQFLGLMAQHQADFTNTFRNLTTHQSLPDPEFADWVSRWQRRIETEIDPTALMLSVNPAFIPRNHRIEQMIQAALTGDLEPFKRLNTVLATPFIDDPTAADLTLPPLPDEEIEATFCGT